MREPGGFTLIELLLALGIVLLLAAIALPVLFKAKEGQLVRNAEAEMELLKWALEQYKADFGDYPPSFLSDLGDPRSSDAQDPHHVPCQGNKALVACLATNTEKGPYLKAYVLKADKVKPTDVLADHDPTGWTFKDLRYRELLDPWGTPYIYLHNRDYDPETTQVYTMEGLAQEEGAAENAQYEMPCTVKAQRDDDNVYHGTYSFQLWSCGPNRTNDNGGEDDITSWHKQ